MTVTNSEHNTQKYLLLIGPPNSGKTSLFNWLTGFQHKTVNYPGSTMLISTGMVLKKYNLSQCSIKDSPGIYSIFPKSQDEHVTIDFLLKKEQNARIILVLDASKLHIQLPLFFQLQEAGLSVIIALTMWDLVPAHSLQIQKLQHALSVPIFPINGIIGDGIMDLVSGIPALLNQKQTNKIKLQTWNQKTFQNYIKKSQTIIQNSLLKNTKNASNAKNNIFISNRFDKLFLHPKIGLFLFCCIMFGLFCSIFWLASPMMSAVDYAFSFIIDMTSKNLQAYPRLSAFISQGLLAGFGAVVIFAPQIFILFIGISLLEDTGYLARAVALMDGPFSKIGLSGRSFISFLSGHACAIPSILALRNCSSKRERWLAYFAIPFMTCSARLPVYALLLSFLFYNQASYKPGLALSVIYIMGFFLGILVCALLNVILKKDQKEDFFVLDLPVYRRPVFKKIIHNAWSKTQHYLFKAGPAIFVVAFGMWLLMNMPFHEGLKSDEHAHLSYAAQIGKFIEPMFQAMGLDWRVGIALIASLAAREIFVSTLILVLGIAGATESHSILHIMQLATKPDGTLIFTTASVVSLIVFFMISLQCLSTTAVIYKESKSLKLALTQLLSLNIIAYLLSVATYQLINMF